MTDPLQHISLADIYADALPRDRGAQDAEAQTELEHSILSHGLRQPIEVWQLSQPQDGYRYGLISGYRRLAACRTLDHDTIPAFLRSPRDIPDALAAMVTENEIRAQISPWEKVRLILDCLHSDLFDSEDAAIATLFGTLSCQKKSAAAQHHTGGRGL